MSLSSAVDIHRPPLTGRDRAARLERPLGAWAVALGLLALLAIPSQTWAQQPVPEAQPTEEEAAQSPTPSDERIDFAFAIPADQGGGRVTGRTGQMEMVSEHYVVLTDRVEVEYRDLTIQADRIELDLEANTTIARGNVIVDQGPRRMAGDTLAFDLNEKTGTLENATAYVDPDFYFRGERISKLGPELYEVESGVFTSCSEEVPDWSFRVARAKVRVEGYARAVHTRAQVKKAPFFYFPYILWPVKSERTSGLLIPNFGYSKQRGGEFGLAYYQVLGRSFDTTFFVDLYGEEGDFLGYGNEFRYRPTEATSGVFRGYVLEDRPNRQSEWKVDWVHDSRSLPGGLRGTLRVREYSDFDFYQAFERQFNRLTTRSLVSSANLSGSWGGQSLNVLFHNQTAFLGQGRELIQRQLPEAEYRLRDTQLGGAPLYFSLFASGHYLEVEPPEAESFSYGRTDWIPNLELALSGAPWLSASFNGGARLTHYTDSIDLETGERTGEALTRTVPQGTVEITGPSFSRIYDRPTGRFARFKHLIEPQITYRFVDEFEDQGRVLNFDEVDRVEPRNRATVAIVNRIMAKPHPPEPEDEALEVAASDEAEGPEAGEATEPGEAPEETEETPVEDTAEEPDGEEGDEAEEATDADDEAPSGVADTEEGTSSPGVVEQLEKEESLSEEYGVGDQPAGGGLDLDAIEASTVAAREILSFSIAQSIGFDPDRPLQRLQIPEDPELGLPARLQISDWSPVIGTLRFNPREGVSLQSEVLYSTLASELLSTQLSGGVKFSPRASVGLSWFTQYDPLTGDARSDQARLYTSLQIVPDKLQLSSQVNYDIVRSLLQQQVHAFTWFSQCWTLTLQYRDFESVQRQITDVRLLVSLKNVGSFLDINSGRRSIF